MEQPRHVLVVGNGMVGQRFVERLIAADIEASITITVIGEESRPAYDRVALSGWFDGKTDADLNLVADTYLNHERITYRFGVSVAGIDTGARTVALDNGSALAYDELVLATGSYPFVPPIEGHDGDGTFVYRTLDDLQAMKAWVSDTGARTGIVIGGGLLGLEAANALGNLGLDTHVVEMAPYPMPAQLGQGGGRMLARWVDSLGVHLHCGTPPTRFRHDRDGRVTALEMEDGRQLDADIVVFSCGIRPRDELACVSGIKVGERGGIVVDDGLATSAAGVYAIGEVALHDGRIYGLVAPGYEMAGVLADRLAGNLGARFTGADMSTKLKLLGVDVASFGASNASDGVDEIVYNDPLSRIYRRLILDADTGRLLGGALVGDVTGYEMLLAITLGPDEGGVEQPDELASYVLPASVRPPDDAALPDAAVLCSCNAVSVGAIRSAVTGGCHTLGALKEVTCAGTSCGGCVPAVNALMNQTMTTEGLEVSNALCEHFDHSRQELFDLIRFHGHTTWSAVIDQHGRGLGCEICRPTVASILASLHHHYVLDQDRASLQDTNDMHLANMQRNGTYSVVPRVPGGEITPDQLIALGHIANEFGLYTKITGGQRIDLFGARLHELPLIWQRVIDAGMESGHAYGKSLRTVKSCVGSTWCRYGVQDSVTMAIDLEQRYRGLRSPHKIKMGVSGCTRECAEAQGKDVGVIATENGWNLYIAGNGGRSPRHADLLAADLDDAELVTAIDRFLSFYIRTADRLQRTATWLEELDGGLSYVKSVIFDDALGICDELDAHIEQHVGSYECEWKATLDDPERLAHFVEFVNDPEARSTPVWLSERGQRVPA